MNGESADKGKHEAHVGLDGGGLLPILAFEGLIVKATRKLPA
jgi:hypothetical protein